MGKKLTIQDLLKQKEDLKTKKNQTRELYVPSLDGTIIVKMPTRDQCVTAMSMDTSNGDVFVVYECVVSPNLKDKELQKEFGCAEPTDIVTELFQPGEITSIATELVDMAGYKNGVKRVADEIKN